MTTYFITFAHVFEAAAFKQFIQSYPDATVVFINSRHCRLQSLDLTFLQTTRSAGILSNNTVIKRKYINRGKVKYIIL